MNKLIASFKLQNKDENVGLERMTSTFFQTDFTDSDVAIWEERKEKNSCIDYGSFSFLSTINKGIQ